MATFSTLSDILLVIFGFNTLVFLALVQPGRGAEVIVGTVAALTLMIGVYRTAREMVLRG